MLARCRWLVLVSRSRGGCGVARRSILVPPQQNWNSLISLSFGVDVHIPICQQHKTSPTTTRSFTSRNANHATSGTAAANTHLTSEWIRQKNRLMSMDEGTMQPKDWHGATELMKEAVANEAIFTDKRRIQDCFEFLDVLMQEKRVTGQAPLDSYVMQAVLVAWGRFVGHVAKPFTNRGSDETSALSSAPSSTDSPSQSTLKGMLDSLWNIVFDSMPAKSTALPPQLLQSLDDLAPSLVFSKVWRFAETGLVEKDTRLFGVVVHVMAKVEPDKVEETVRWMEEQKDDNLKPHSRCWTAALTGWRNLGAPERCEALLRDLIEQSRNKRINLERLNSVHFNIAIAAWSESTEPAAAMRANDIFEIMGQVARPDLFAYSALLWAWARSRKTDAHIQVERIFHQMQQAWKDGDDTVKPDAVSYHAVLAALSRSSWDGALDKAFDVFEEMKQAGIAPNAAVYNTIISACHRKNKHAQNRALSLFREMKAMGITPNLATYTIIMWTHVERGQPGKVEEAFQDLLDNRLQPSSNILTTRLQAWSKAGNPEMATTALKEMIERSDAGTLGRELNAQDFTTVLQAWARSDRPDSGLMAERGLRQMLEMAGQGRFDCLPTKFAFVAVIAALRSSQTPNFGQRSLTLLSDLKELGRKNPEDPLFQPDARLYLTVIDSVTCGGLGEDVVRKLLDEMELSSASPNFWRESFDRQVRHTVIALRSSSFVSKRELIARPKNVILGS